MQQSSPRSSNLPECNPEVAQISLLPTVEQLKSSLWLEGTLNRLKLRVKDYLLSTLSKTNKDIVTQENIWQIVVDELHQALNDGVVSSHFSLGIATFAREHKIGRVCYTSPYSTSLNTNVDLPNHDNFPILRLNKSIRLEELYQMEKQEPQSAWSLFEDTDGSISWLIVVISNIDIDNKNTKKRIPPLKLELINKTVENYSEFLTQFKEIQSYQEYYQKLAHCNQELEKNNQLKNQFLANTSHEIRTPLSAIIGFTHLLLAQGYQPDKQKHQEYLHIIQSSGKHLLELINDILDLSKIEANQLELQWEIIDVQTLCKNVLALVKEKAANKGLKLLLDIEQNVKNLIADPLRMKQMLLNLLFNAVKFTSKGSVGLKVSIQDQFLLFTVWDTGTGISPQDKALLFRPYSQIINPGVSRNEGTGLGLVVTQKLVEIHGGYLQLDSVVNKGSRFTIFMPLQVKEKGLQTIELSAKNNELMSVNDTMKNTILHNEEILLVEDDIPNAELMKIYLRNLGYQVNCVKTAAEMLRSLREHIPAIILLDVSLPDVNGLNLVKKLRENPQYQHIPIIAQTAMAMKGDREICLAAGMNDYISKPIDLQLLASMVGKYCQLISEVQSADP